VFAFNVPAIINVINFIPSGRMGATQCLRNTFGPLVNYIEIKILIWKYGTFYYTHKKFQNQNSKLFIGNEKNVSGHNAWWITLYKIVLTLTFKGITVRYL